MDKKQSPSQSPLANANGRTDLLAKAAQDVEALQLAVAAYAAKDIKALLAQPTQKGPALADGLAKALTDAGDFTKTQAVEFAQRYTPVAALDDAGAGAVIFRDRTSDSLLLGVRGTDVKGNFASDAKADAILALGHLPLDQTTRITNFVLKHTVPEGHSAVQLAVKGVNNANDDLARAYIANKLGHQVGTALQGFITGRPIAPFELVMNGHVPGTGLALGACRLASGHSKGGPEILVANGVMGCGNATTYNAPHAPMSEMQSFVNQATHLAQLPSVTLADYPTRRIGASGPSLVNGLFSPRGTDQHVLPITPTYNPITAHGSASGMNAAEQKLALILANPQINTDEQARVHLARAQTDGLERRRMAAGEPDALQGGAQLANSPIAPFSQRPFLAPTSVTMGTPLLTAALASQAFAFAKQQGLNGDQTEAFLAALGQAALRRDGPVAGPLADTKVAQAKDDISYNVPRPSQTLSR
jgi:hypothetical protein